MRVASVSNQSSALLAGNHILLDSDVEMYRDG